MVSVLGCGLGDSVGLGCGLGDSVGLGCGLGWGLGDTARAAAAYQRALELAPGTREPALNLERLRASAGPHD